MSRRDKDAAADGPPGVRRSRPIVIIEGKPKSAWVPRHTERRTKSPRAEVSESVERQRRAEQHRTKERNEMVARMTAHHYRVNLLHSKKGEPLSGRKSYKEHMDRRYQNADKRREALQDTKKQKVTDHLQRVGETRTRIQATTTAKVPQKKLSMAGERRDARLKQKKDTLAQHSEKVRTAKDRRKQTEAVRAKADTNVIKRYKRKAKELDTKNGDIEEVQRRLASQETLNHAKDLLRVLSKHFEKVMLEEKVAITDETPVGQSPARSRAAIGRMPLNPRAFLAAYICQGGLSEGPSEAASELEKAVQEHATRLLNCLNELLATLELTGDDTTSPASTETKAAVKNFAREWAGFETSFASWKRQDHSDLLQHYIDVYSELVRGKSSVKTDTETSQELHSAIDTSLDRLQQKIERLGGADGVAKLSTTLQRMYDAKQLLNSPASQAAPTPPRAVAPLPPPDARNPVPPTRLAGLRAKEKERAAAAAAAAQDAAALAPAQESAARETTVVSHDVTALKTPRSAMAADCPQEDPETPEPAEHAPANPAAPSPAGAVPPPPRATPEELQHLQELWVKASLARDAVFNPPMRPAAEGRAMASGVGVPATRPGAANPFTGGRSGELDDVNALPSEPAVDNAGGEVQVSFKAIQRIAEKAFFDLLGEELTRQPPKTDRLGGAIDGLKQGLLDVTPQKMKAAREAELADAIDLSSIEKDGVSLDMLKGMVDYFVERIMEMEAPADNDKSREQRAQLFAEIDAAAVAAAAAAAAAPPKDEATAEDAEGGEEEDEGAPTKRAPLSPVAAAVSHSLHYLHARLAQLKQEIEDVKKQLMQPALAAGAEEAVRELYATEQRMGVHGFQNVRGWLRHTLERVLPVNPATPVDPAFEAPQWEGKGLPAFPLKVDDVTEKTAKLHAMLPVIGVMSCVLHPASAFPPPKEPGQQELPETLSLHVEQLRKLANRSQMIVLTAVMSALAAQVSGVPQVAKPVTDEIQQLLDTRGVRLPYIIERITAIVEAEAAAHNVPFPDAKRELLKNMMNKVTNADDHVYKVYHAKLTNAVLQAALLNKKTDPFPPLAGRVDEFMLELSKLATVHARWCKPFYDPVVGELAGEVAARREAVMESGEL